MISIDYGKLGATIRAARRKAQVTLPEIAEQIGCTSGFWSKVERGERKPSLEAVCKACYVTKLSLDELVEKSMVLTNDAD